MSSVLVPDDDLSDASDDQDHEDSGHTPLLQDQAASLLHLSHSRPRNTRLLFESDLDRPSSSPHKVMKCSWRRCLVITTIILVSITGLIMLLLTDQEEVHSNPTLPQLDFVQPENMITFRDILEDNFQFDYSGSDVMVFLHIQKTGGTTFGKHLVKDIDLGRPCDCHRGRWGNNKQFYTKKMRCDCFRPGKNKKHWLFSRYSTGWKCGLHPDWTELVDCVDDYLKGLEGGEVARRYFYITFLREPVARYLSEYRHVKRGATWKTAEHKCGGRSWSKDIPKCYEDDDYEDGDWSDVELDEFMSCQDNLAINRQVRMLADLDLVGCYNKSSMPSLQRDALLLASAKTNLERMAYFGLTEEQRISQFMFEETFNLQFKVIFENYNGTHSSRTREKLSEGVIEKIKRINSLDVELYEFSLKLLKDRFARMKSEDHNYDQHAQHLTKDEKNEFSWGDIEKETWDYEQKT